MSQTKKRTQVMAGRPAIRRMQKRVLRMGMTGPEGDAEAAAAGGVFVAEDDDADGDQDEGEEGADVRHLREGADVQQAGGDGDEDAGDPGGEGGGAELGVDARKDVGEELVAGHGEPDSRLTQLKDQNGTDHADDGSEQDG